MFCGSYSKKVLEFDLVIQETETKIKSLDVREPDAAFKELRFITVCLLCL